MNISSKPVARSEALSEDAYISWHRLVEPRLRSAFVAEFGPELGRDATPEALSYVWENRERVLGLDNAAGYAFRVGQRWARRQRRTSRRAFMIDDKAPVTPGFAPELHSALAALSTRQRQVVVLCVGYGLTHAEVAALLGISRSSVQNHVERGLRHLRTEIKP